MTLLRLALRNLLRNRRRTALSVAIVAFGTAAIVLVAGFVRFSFDGLGRALVHGGLGHLEVAVASEVARKAPGSLDRQASAGIDDWRALRDQLERIDGVTAVGATLHLFGLAQTAGGASASFVAVGVEPDRERKMEFTTRMRSGEPLADAAPAPGEDRVLLAVGLAETLGVAAGEPITLVASAGEGMLNALDVTVAGVYTTGVAELDSRFTKLPLASASRLAETERVSNLIVTLDDDVSLDAAARAIRAAVAGREPALAVVPWTERAPFYDQVRGLYTGIFRFLGTIVLLLVVLSVSNTLVSIVFERMRELGTLRAIGTTPGQIAAILAAEAAALGAVGAAAGSLLGAGALLAVNAAGLQMPPPPGAVDPIDLRLAFVPEAFVGAAALMIVVLLVASLVPIVKAIRIKVIDALASV